MLKKGHFLLRTLCHITQHNILSTVSVNPCPSQHLPSTTGLKVMKLNFQDSFPLLDWLWEAFTWDLGGRREGRAIILSHRNFRQANGHQQMADMWMHQQLPVFFLKMAYVAATCYWGHQQPTLWDFCSHLISKKTSLWLLLSEFPESQQYPPWSSLPCPVPLRVM